MTDLNLGAEPLSLTVVLGDGDFNQQLQRKDGADWPADAVITLEFANGAVWTATIAGDLATWQVDRADVQQIIESGRTQSVTLRYVDSSPTDVVWAVGSTQVKINA